ncbi:hypothetical protein JZ751_006677 [Albula glossodonta]|uniref:Calpain catalytic domain-containing protein n=1 Tax=Albula glossodonta TaxID=121402 RepID=A0A8T2P3Q7_9TELE|nr:hypothetical protein JZ751_006677 [Albula glossodonta]
MVESVLNCGLVRGHAYGITAVRKMRLGENLLGVCGTSRALMVRMRNPWGTADWTGAWSQGSQKWQQVGRSEREKMGLTVRDVGEFWMEFEDFCHFFTDVVVCRLAEQALLWSSSHWREVRCPGEWAPAPGDPPVSVPLISGLGKQGDQKFTSREGARGPKGDRKEDQLGKRQRDGTQWGLRDKVGGGKGGERITRREGQDCRVTDGSSVHRQMDNRSRCGGCINHRDTFLLNPQFMFEVQGEGDEVLICLQQEDRRIRRKEGRGENLPIGFEVLRMEVNRTSRVHCVGEQAASSVYMDSRSVALRVTLGAGRYALLPTTFHPGTTGRELKEDLPPPSFWQCCMPQPSVVTTVHLRRASGLGQPKKPGDAYQ